MVERKLPKLDAAGSIPVSRSSLLFHQFHPVRILTLLYTSGISSYINYLKMPFVRHFTIVIIQEPSGFL